MKKNGIGAQGLIWFGAAVSVAEIEAGIQIGANWAALLAGHLFGGVLLFAAGLIGAYGRKNAMTTTGEAFGLGGARFFAALNVLQLVGWTAVMISQGAAAMSALTGIATIGWNALLALLIALWIFIGLGGASRLATLSMSLLALLCVLLTYRFLGMESATIASEAAPLGFWPAFELSAAMPLSWLPLISDYTKDAERPVAGTAVSALVYTVVSTWMFALGMLLAERGSGNLAADILHAGRSMVVPGLIVVILSTVTTTFLDAYSAGESALLIWGRLRPRLVGVAVCVLGAVLAFVGIVDRYIDFLYLIASVFAPMAAVLLVSHYVVRRSHPWWNLVAWLAGFLAYGYLTYLNPDASPIGPTLTTMLLSAILALLVRLVPASRPAAVS